MAKKKYKKRQHSTTVEAKRQAEQERLADEKSRSRNRMNPTARLLLYGDLVFLAATSLLYANNLLSDVVSGMCTIIGLILLILALRIQFGSKNGGNPKL